MSLEQLITDTLQECADDPAYPSTRYWDVVDRAAAIRNRRRHRVLAVATSAAIVVPLAIAGPAIHRALGDAPAAPRPTHAPSNPPSHHPRSHHEAPPPTLKVRPAQWSGSASCSSTTPCTERPWSCSCQPR